MTITPGTGLVINVSYDSSVTSAPNGFRSAVAAAVLDLESRFTNQITLNISVGYGTVAGLPISSGALAQSRSSGVTVPYAQLAAVLPGLPASDPTGNGLFYISNAEARVLGLAGTGAALDGSVGLSSAFNFTYDPNNRAIPGQYDAIGALEHEITEVMGRTSEVGVASLRRQPLYTPLDLFRYSGVGTRIFTNGVSYFSTDGVTMQTQFNNPANGADGGDWDTSVQGDAFGDSYSGQLGQITPADLVVMSAIGWSTTTGGGPGAGVYANYAPTGGVAQTVTCDNLADAILARSLIAGLPGTGVVQVSSAGQYVIAGANAALVSSAPARVTVFGGANAGQRVISGAGGLAFNAGSGAGTVLAAGGNNLISVYPGAGAQNITTGDGDDTISALAGANTISAGLGRNLILVQGGNNIVNSAGNDLISAPDGNPTISSLLSAPTIFLGSGHALINNSHGNPTVVVGSAAATVNSGGRGQLWMQAGGGYVFSTNADTVIAGSGAVTVNAATGSDFVFAGTGPLNFSGGTGASTILGVANGRATLSGGTIPIGGSGTVIAIAYGTTTFQPQGGSATIAAFGGSVTVTAGQGSGVYLGGPAGNNLMMAGLGASHATMIGGGDGDQLFARNQGGDVMQAGPGAVTMSALGSWGANKFYGGPGRNLMLLGTGNDQVLTGTGAATIVGGNLAAPEGSGRGLIAFVNGNHPDVQIQSFGSGQNFISLVGFAAGEVTRALSSATTAGGSQNLLLSDGTKIQFLGITGLTNSNFL